MSTVQIVRENKNLDPSAYLYTPPKQSWLQEGHVSLLKSQEEPFRCADALSASNDYG